MSRPHQDIPAIVLVSKQDEQTEQISRSRLEHLLDYLVGQGITETILTTGNKTDLIEAHVGSAYRSMSISYSYAENHSGSGQAIKKAFVDFDIPQAFVIVSDDFVGVSLSNLFYFHTQWQSELTLSLKYMQNVNRRDIIDWDAKNKLQQIHASASSETGWVNRGLYLMNRSVFKAVGATSFSVEEDLLKAKAGHANYYVLPSPSGFMDTRYLNEHFRSEHKKTFFLDRDGVINRRIVGGYVRSIDQFDFLPGVISALKKLQSIAERIIIVTNQQGVGKGLMTKQHIYQLHDDILEALMVEGVSVQAVYFAPGLAHDNPDTRKPNVGMAQLAKMHFPSIDWTACVMVGDSTSDIEFGLRMGMHTILVADKSDTKLADEKFDDLPTYVSSLEK